MESGAVSCGLISKGFCEAKILLEDFSLNLFKTRIHKIELGVIQGWLIWKKWKEIKGLRLSLNRRSVASFSSWVLNVGATALPPVGVERVQVGAGI